MDKVDVLIVGAGVIGLAIASLVARKDRDLFIVEKEANYGQATSSRNSEVIHAGIYYPKNTLKAELCVKANPLIYDICRKNNIPHKKTGKLIVANGENEIKQLEEIFKRGQENSVRDLQIINTDEVHRLEPKVKADQAILSPSTGIIDAHGLMDHFYKVTKNKTSVNPLVLGTNVVDIDQTKDGYIIETKNGNEIYQVETRVLINSSGLYADTIAEMVGIKTMKEGYKIHWCKGDYFSLIGTPPAEMLIYPPPPEDEASLGIHTVPDLAGRLRFGPNAYYVDEINYKVESDCDSFYQCISRYLPSIRKENLQPDMSGIRAKIQGPDEPVKDFIIKNEEELGFPGFINLIGIESPGLTCSPTIAQIVEDLVNEYLD